MQQPMSLTSRSRELLCVSLLIGSKKLSYRVFHTGQAVVQQEKKLHHHHRCCCWVPRVATRFAVELQAGSCVGLDGHDCVMVQFHQRTWFVLIVRLVNFLALRPSHRLSADVVVIFDEHLVIRRYPSPPVEARTSPAASTT